MVLLATVMWSSNGLFAKAKIFDSWQVDSRGMCLAFYRALFAGLFLLPFVRTPRWRPSLSVLLLSFPIMSMTFLTSMTLTTAANAIWLQATSPLWVFLLGTLIFHYPIVRHDLFSVSCGLLGAAVIVGCELTWGAERPGEIWGIICGLISGITFGLIVLTMRHLRDENPAFLVALSHLAAALVLLPFVLRFGVWPTVEQWVTLVCFGVFQMGLPYLLFVTGLKHIASQEAAGLSMLEPILAPCWVLLVWGEWPRSWTMAGACLILIGLLIRYAASFREAKAQPEKN